MPGHESRYCTYQITYTDTGTGKTWDRTFCRQVRTDPDIDQFKRECQNRFLRTFPNRLIHADMVFHDGFQKPPKNVHMI
jgi:hypothetical protein